MRIGVQGGRGSHNEDALQWYAHQENISVEIIYFLRSQDVIEALRQKGIERGQCALSNSIGGFVQETLEAIAHVPIAIEKVYERPVSHSLLLRPDGDLLRVKKVIAHSQALAQSKDILQRLVPNAQLIAGETDGLPHAKVAELMAAGTFASDVATIGSERLAEMYGLSIAAKKLEGDAISLTTYILLRNLCVKGER